MKRLLSSIFLLATVTTPHAAPIALHPDNPHYFQWRGQPAVITSGEHYGDWLELKD